MEAVHRAVVELQGQVDPEPALVLKVFAQVTRGMVSSVPMLRSPERPVKSNQGVQEK